MFFNAELGRRLVTESHSHPPEQIKDALLRVCIEAFFAQGLNVLGYPGHQGSEDPDTGRGPQLQDNMIKFRTYARAAPAFTTPDSQQPGLSQGRTDRVGGVAGRRPPVEAAHSADEDSTEDEDALLGDGEQGTGADLELGGNGDGPGSDVELGGASGTGGGDLEVGNEGGECA